MARQSRLQIEHQCPQCGAPIVLEETDRLFSCRYCKVNSFLFPGDFFRYVLPHAAPEGKALFYVPYWRFKGILFSSLLGRIDHRIVDVSYQALESKVFPVSVGLRSQAMKLRFVSPETEGHFLKPGVPLTRVVQGVEQRFSTALPSPVFARCFVGETLSQIYAPYYMNGQLYDAVLNRPVASPPPEAFDAMALPGGTPNWQIRFIPAQCPVCGWDLEGERDSIALNCRNCDTLWTHAKKGFRKLEFGHVPENKQPVLFLPFYRIHAGITGLALRSYADLIRVANLPKVVQRGMEKRLFHFWSPAFKIRPGDFLRFSLALTLSQPEETWIPGMPKTESHPVTLSIPEALESLKISLAGFMKPPGTMLPTLPDIEIAPKSLALVYFPFHVQGSEIFHPGFQLRTTRNILHYARNL